MVRWQRGLVGAVLLASAGLLAASVPAQTDPPVAEALTAQPAPQPDTPETLASRALERFRAQDYTAADQLAQRILDTDPGDRQRAGALALQAESRYALGRTDEAMALLRQAIRANPDQPTYKRRLAVWQERLGFRVTDITVDAERSLATACAVFSGALRKPLPLPAGDYVALSPAADVDVSASGNRLCLRGLRHGQRYTLTLKAGLPGSKGALARADTRIIDVGNRAERVTLGNGRYVLPRAGQALVPIRSVNVSTVHLSLYGIGERNLIWALGRDRLGQDLSQSDGREIGQAEGEALWEGTLAVQNRRNQDVTTLITLERLLKGRPAGLYVLVARTPAEEAAEESWQPRATQWLIVSDLGLTALDGADGLTVLTRALSTARPTAGVRLQVIAQNNSVLGEATTNADGKARFFPGIMRGTGGRAPAYLLARGSGGDLNVLRLTGAALDLSERGVDGQPAVRTPLDAHLFSERGLYRPGETIRLTTLVRTSAAVAVPKLPLTLSLVRPDGRELTKLRGATDALGALALDVPLPAGARSGRWTLRAFADPAAPAIGELSVQVQDFVPQRIELSARTLVGPVDPATALPVTLAGRYYFGPAASSLPGEATVRIVADDEPFPAFKGWSFGRVEEGFEPAAQAPVRFATDAAGRTQLSLGLGEVPSSTRPLRALVGLTLFDVGGRPVYVQVGSRLRTAPVLLALKSRFGDSLAEGETARVDVMALSPEGRALANRPLVVSWVREDYDTAWYQDGGTWYARSVVNDTLVASQQASTDARGRLLLARSLPAGRYRLEVEDPASEAVSTWRFWSGWWSSGEVANAPDALELNLERDDLAAGDTLRAVVKAPFDGQALVAVVSNRVHVTQAVALKKSGTTVSLPVDPAWGPGAYLLVTAYRPQAGAVSPLPVRAMGLAWFSIDRARRTLPVRFTAPTAVAPRQTVSIPVQVEGASGGAIGVVVAAVDEGVLALTRFASPKPEDHYLGRRQLGLDVRDLYGQLIQPAEGSRGALTRTGGDAAMENATGLTVRTTKVVALVNRTVRLDAAGRGQVALALPDFAGRLRLMAVAYDASRVGSGEAALVVRDPVVADLILPRFLAPGDQAQATLTLHNLTAAPVTASPALTLGSLRGPAAIRPVTLAPGQRVDVPVPLSATTVGTTKLGLTLPLARAAISRSWDIEVRPVAPVTTTRRVTILQAGQSSRLDATLLSGLAPASTRVSLALATRPDVDVGGLLTALDQYPYGCTEQIVSGALPLIYYADVAAGFGLGSGPADLKSRVDRTILRVLDRQTSDGGMGLWSSADTTDPWVSAYAHDFLTRARAAGHAVPERALGELQRYLVGQVSNDWNNTPESRAYALAVLARTGAVKASDVRYFAEQTGGTLRTRLAVAQLGYALAAVGEGGAARAQFARAARVTRPADEWRDYGSTVRDAAASLVMLADATKDPAARLQQASALEQLIARERWPWSTQDQAWLLLAVRAVSDISGGAVQAEVGGRALGPSAQAIRQSLTPSQLQQGVSIINRGQGPLRVLTSVRGQPTAAPAPFSTGITVRRRLISPAGNPVDAGALRQNDRVIVVLEGEVSVAAAGHPLVVDLLPAGLEIEAVLTPESAAGTPVADLLTPARFADARDDRFVAAADLSGPGSYRLAYVARAVTPGRFVHPGAFVEDMYQPRFAAQGAAGSLVVARR
jgi:uncharacterized protein YfaS (alpha-2-macroglobulin family)